jgi:serine/threonine protein kinase
MYTAVELLGTSRQKIVIKPQQTADIYSFGIILYEMVSNNFEYRNESIMEIRKKFGEENARPKIP